MKVVALISGGKDSTYNMIFCNARGHEVVCLANLFPPDNAGEIDSFMYQVVGNEGIEMVAEALELPLYRQEITGQPNNTEMSYCESEGDEVEDLYRLLRLVKERYPDVEGVSAGAINSTYQKLRVEDVCRRLGLTPLCYLWEMDQLSLLDEMIGAGIDAILIKVAAMGLDARHLGLTLPEARSHLLTLHEKYGAHVCGEGGEYESFVLDCPLYKRRISIEQAEVVHHVLSNVAPVAYLKFAKLALRDKMSNT